MRTITKNIIQIVFIAILNLILLLTIKYYQNGLSISDFSLSKLGNIINMLISISLIVPCILVIINIKQYLNIKLNSASVLSIIYFIIFLVYLLLLVAPIDLPKIYWLGYPLKKILPVLFLTSYQIIQIWVIIFLWSILIKKNNNVYFITSIITLFICFLFVFLTFLYTFNYNEININEEKSKFEIGIVLGAAVWSKDKPSPILIGRIKKAQQLYEKGIIKKIQMTGGNAPGELSEAKVAAKYIIQNYSIDPDVILIEEFTSTTNEQIKFIKENLAKDGNNFSTIIISDDFHLRRIIEIADFYNLKSRVVSSDYNLSFEKSFINRFRDSIGLLLFLFFAV